MHTFSSLMCWASCDRLARICERLELEDRRVYWQIHADKIKEGILRQAWNSEINSFADTFGGDGADASLLLIAELGFLPPDDPRSVSYTHLTLPTTIEV